MVALSDCPVKALMCGISAWCRPSHVFYNSYAGDLARKDDKLYKLRVDQIAMLPLYSLTHPSCQWMLLLPYDVIRTCSV